MRVKDTYFVRLYDTETPARTLGIGECALFRGLGSDDRPDYEQRLAEACLDPVGALRSDYSSIRFGFETALGYVGGLDSPWMRGETGITTNGLVWMGDRDTMARRIDEKLEQGFHVLKIKIGGIDFNQEVGLLRGIRDIYPADVLEIRLDANGSFTAENAMSRLGRLAAFGIHSIEQPVKAGQPELMADICRRSPIPVALDEELIGMRSREEAGALLESIRPQYIILKPSLCGGFACADGYIDVAGQLGIGWWATSALESNVGLEAIARWCASKSPVMPQGLGTGLLYSNNIDSPLRMRGESLFRDPAAPAINIDSLEWID